MFEGIMQTTTYCNESAVVFAIEIVGATALLFLKIAFTNRNKRLGTMTSEAKHKPQFTGGERL